MAERVRQWQDHGGILGRLTQHCAIIATELARQKPRLCGTWANRLIQFGRWLAGNAKTGEKAGSIQIRELHAYLQSITTRHVSALSPDRTPP
jgi:hypothetical protein